MYTILPFAFQFGMKITIEDYDGKELMTKTYTKIHKARLPQVKEEYSNAGKRVSYYEAFNIQLKNLCQEIINDAIFKKSVAVQVASNEERNSMP